MNEPTQTPVPTWQSALLPVAVLALVGALFTLLAGVEGADTWANLLTGVAVLLILVQGGLSWPSIRQGLVHRSTFYTLNSLLQVGLTLGILLMVDTVAWTYSERAWWMPKWDLTAEGLHTLSDQTLRTLERLDKRKTPVKVTAFFLEPKGSTRRELQLLHHRLEVKDLMERYQRRTDKLDFRLVDPERDPLEARKYEVTVNGTVFLETEETRIELTAADLFTGGRAPGSPVKFLGEQVFTSKLLDILDGVQRKIYFTTGHREGDLRADERQGFSQFRTSLERDGYLVERANLLVLPEVPEDCTVLVLLGPKLEFGESEVAAIRRYLGRNRPMLVMMDSQPYVESLAGLLEEFGLVLRENILIENDPERHVPGRPTFAFPFLNGHHVTNPLIEDGVGVAMDEVLGLDRVGAQGAYDIRTLLQSSGYSWGETDIGDGQIRVREDERDLKNPVSLAFAVSSRFGSNDGLEKRPETELRMVVIGDSDMASNALLEVQGNRDFLMNALAWLTRDAERLTIRPKQITERKATLSEKSANRIMWGLSAALPLLVLALGFAVWMQRRQP